MSDGIYEASQAASEIQDREELLKAAARYLSDPSDVNLENFVRVRKSCWPAENHWPFGENREGTVMLLYQLRDGNVDAWAQLLSDCIRENYTNTDFFKKFKAASPFADKQLILVGQGLTWATLEVRGETSGIFKEGYRQNVELRDSYTFMAIPK